MSGLELQGLHKRFGDVVALANLDLSVNSGEFVSFLGPSGCGKTTALRIVAGFEWADRGRVLVDGKDITSTPANRRDMGMVFQAYSLFPNLTARENVAFGLRVRRVATAERSRRAGELLDLVGLAAAADRYPHQLSGGQQQRVALARAVAIEPRVLLLDEPLSALDAQVRVQLRDEIRRIQRRLGITALYVTHDQEEALSVSDRVVVLSQGKIEQVGTPAEIYGAPNTPFVARFIGTMNRLPATIEDPESGLVHCETLTLRADAARAWPRGARVLALIRPEAIEITPTAADGHSDTRMMGTINSQTFLGAATRLRVGTAVGEITVDVGTTRAFALSDGASVALTWDPAAVRLIALTEGDDVAADRAQAPVPLTSSV